MMLKIIVIVALVFTSNAYQTSSRCKLQGSFHIKTRSLTNLYTSNTVNELSDKTVKELKDLLKLKGLPVGGVKSELVDRLMSPVDFLKNPIVKPKKSGSLLRKLKVIFDDNVSVVIEGSNDDKKLIDTDINKKKIEENIGGKTPVGTKSGSGGKNPVGVNGGKPPVGTKQIISKERELNKEKDKKGRIAASYDIDDDDFYDDFYGGGKTPVGVKGAGSEMFKDMDVQEGEVKVKNDKELGLNMVEADDDLQRMIDERTAAKHRRDYDEADAVREQLKIIFNVEINDRLGEWSSPDGRWGLLNKRQGLPGEEQEVAADAIVNPYTREQIQEMVNNRTVARRTRNFPTADDIRDELSDNGVEMFDKVNEWRTCDGTMRGFQSEDFETYSTEKDRDRYDRSYTDEKGPKV